jgi:hypothetical protein
MKLFYLILLISLNYKLSAQKSTFVRVYNLTGQKIYKGDVLMVTDSSLQLKGKSTPMNIPVRDIGSIKTKRSAGHNILIGSIAGASSMAIFGAATADPDEFLGYTAGEGIAAGILIGAPPGVIIGGISALFKNPDTYLIDGDILKWKVFQKSISETDAR